MGKLKISESDKRLLLILLAVVLLAASYFLVFNKNMNEAQEIEESNLTDSQRVLELQSKQARQAAIRQETEDSREEIKELLEKYPNDVTEEKAMDILQDIEDRADFKVSQVSFVADNVLGAVEDESTEASDTDTAASAEGTDTEPAVVLDESGEVDVVENANDVAGGYLAATVEYKASYKGLKQLMTYVNKYADRMTIPAITATYDSETGKLSGTFTLNMYYVRLVGREYQAPEIEGISKGVTDIFGTGKGKKKK
jgi:hypothetical protein